MLSLKRLRLPGRLLLVLLCLSVYGCGGSVSEAENQVLDSDQPDPVESPDDTVITPPTGPAASGDTLNQLPKVIVGARQFADPNVMVTLDGTVEAAEGAQIERTLWVQTAGSPVRIADPTSTRTAIVIPDLIASGQLEFRLIAEDNEGRVNSALTSIVVVPQPLFIRVIGAVVNESDVAAVFKVRLGAPATEQIVLLYRTVEGTALVESDFLPVEGVLTFEVGEQEKEVAVTLVDDDLPEEFKSFSLWVSRSGTGTPVSNSGVAVINNGVEPQADQVIGFVNAGPIALVEGETYTNPLDGTLTPQGQGEIVYTSFNPVVATVDANGLVTALSPGVATIEVTRKADETYREATASFDISVSASNLTAQVIQFQNAGPVDVLINAVASNPIVDDPQLAPGSGAITYFSSAVAIAMVDASGNVVPVSAGSTTITAIKAADLQYASATANYQLNVSLLPQDIAFANPSLAINVGETGSNPLDTSVVSPGTGLIAFSSSDPLIASVNATGLVTGVSGGTATITVTKAADSLYGEATDSYEVTVSGLLQQTVFFVQPDMTVATNGGVASNPLAASSVLGIGAITYVSSDTAIATVDASGIVTGGTQTGQVTITGTVDPDGVYAGSSASYTLTVVESNTPFLEAYIKASNAEAGDQFGGSIANRGVDFDGDALIIGAAFEDSQFQGTPVETDNSITNSGAAYVFRRGATGQWIQEAFLKSTVAEFADGFGHDVAIAGNVAAVGAPFVNGTGAVYVFNYDPNTSTWLTPVPLFAPADVSSFGSNVVINSTGDVIAVSAPSADQVALPAVYVYRFNGASWVEEAILTGSNTESGDGFGDGLAIEGDTIIVGAPQEDSALSGINAGDGSDNDATDSGAVYIFDGADGNWTQTAYIKHQSNTAGIQMGVDVAIDGTHLAIADLSEINTNGMGYRIYEQQNGVWTQGPQLIYGDSIVMDNNRLIIARVDGEVFINRLNQENLYTSINSIPAQTDNFAQTLAISGDVVVVGVPLDASAMTGIGSSLPTDRGALQSGAVHAYCFDLINGCIQQP